MPVPLLDKVWLLKSQFKMAAVSVCFSRFIFIEIGESGERGVPLYLVA